MDLREDTGRRRTSFPGIPRKTDRKMKNSPQRRRLPRGFSLVELVVTVGILGLIASLAIANLGPVSSAAGISAARQKAREIVTVFNAGEMMGAPEFMAVTDVAAAMDAVGTGAHGSGVNKAMVFRVPGVSAAMDDGKPEEARAKFYLNFTSGSLIFEKDGAATATSNYGSVPDDRACRVVTGKARR